MSFAGASKHVGVLVKAQLIHRRMERRQQVFTLDPRPMAEMRD
ncbi:hypothetical protein [uncultured Algimonas sp.]|nr:hypothetical protein [uncultured Algimonas sp.]